MKKAQGKFSIEYEDPQEPRESREPRKPAEKEKENENKKNACGKERNGRFLGICGSIVLLIAAMACYCFSGLIVCQIVLDAPSAVGWEIVAVLGILLVCGTVLVYSSACLIREICIRR